MVGLRGRPEEVGWGESVDVCGWRKVKKKRKEGKGKKGELSGPQKREGKTNKRERK